MNVIILTSSTYDGNRFIPPGGPRTFVELKDGRDVERLNRKFDGQWRIVRTDRWVFDERVVSALHTLKARMGDRLLDPTGLLGGSRYGAGHSPDDRKPPPGTKTRERGGARQKHSWRDSGLPIGSRSSIDYN